MEVSATHNVENVIPLRIPGQEYAAVYKTLNGLESWDLATPERRTAFYRAVGIMPLRSEQMVQAWHWFNMGWISTEGRL
jgi:hypothetical protein